jgi:hypothetical protein
LLKEDCSIFESNNLDQGSIRKRLAVSESGRWLAHSFDNQINVWDVTNQRSLLCWLIVLSAVLLSLWLAWPRWVKMA